MTVLTPSTPTGSHPAAYGDADVSSVAALLADPGRCKVLFALNDGRALPASLLAGCDGRLPPVPEAHGGHLTRVGPSATIVPYG